MACDEPMEIETPCEVESKWFEKPIDAVLFRSCCLQVLGHVNVLVGDVFFLEPHCASDVRGDG